MPSELASEDSNETSIGMGSGTSFSGCEMCDKEATRDDGTSHGGDCDRCRQGDRDRPVPEEEDLEGDLDCLGEYGRMISSGSDADREGGWSIDPSVEKADRIVRIGCFDDDRPVSKIDAEAIGVEDGGSVVGALEAVIPGGAKEELAVGLKADSRRATRSRADRFF
ncbi:UNVERIFIED_CONTAM: hypothetical protein K2H54_055342 [Gekko kuhli]